MEQHRILRLTKCGRPFDWVTPEEASHLIVKDLVLWTVSEEPLMQLRGGINKLGKRTTLDIPSIIATKGKRHPFHITPPLSNTLLFRRDHNICMYCGNEFTYKDLSRDHIIPRSKGGADVWNNVITSCKKCNHRKAARTPEEANMPLLAVPYVPNIHEHMALRNSHILADQMEFLKNGFSKNFKYEDILH